MKRNLSRRARRLINDFGAARAAYAWVGGGDPEEDAKLLPALKAAKSALCEYVSRLENELETLKAKETNHGHEHQ